MKTARRSVEVYVVKMRRLDPIEKAAHEIERGERWWKIGCGRCQRDFDMEDETLAKIIERDGYVSCAYCGVKLWRSVARAQEAINSAHMESERPN